MFKKDFPIFNDGLIYLDSAASAQKPRCVIDKINHFYTHQYSNVHRGVCSLASQATLNYENARKTVASFIGAKTDEIIFTKGATESINLVASSYAQTLSHDDEILISISEHHANFVPWQQACLKSGAKFKVFNILESGIWDLKDFEKQLTPKTKLVAVSGMSNVLGILNPIQKLIQIAHKNGAQVLVDAAQSICHSDINVQDLDCDYLVFSGHKIYGPTGIGVLYGKHTLLEKLSPYQFGGDMIDKVSINQTTFAKIPARLEAGTPPITQAIALASALDYVSHIGIKIIQQEEQKVFQYLISKLKNIPQIQFLGDPDMKSCLVSFNIKDIHPDDLAMILAKQKICVRVGHHCAMPLHNRLGVSASIRVSLGMYNDTTDIDCFIEALEKSIGFFK